MKIIIGLFVIGTVASLLLFSYFKEPEYIGLRVPALETPEVTVDFPFTDDNQGETLIIKSDKKTYTDFNGAHVYMSVTNTGSELEDMVFLMHFSEQGGKAQDIQEWDASGKKWKDLEISRGDIVLNDSALGPALAKRKPIPENFKASAIAQSAVSAGETRYFRSTVKYPPGSKGEFWIEALGNRGGYGLLDPWYNSAWQYRKAHTINSASGTGTNYQVKINVYYGPGVSEGENVYLSSHSRTDFADVVFTDDDGETALDFWMESKTDGDSAVFWVEVADDLTSSNQSIYIYYGNPSQSTSASDGANTFLFFDTFDSFDAAKWTATGAYTVTGSTLIATTGSVYTDATVVSTAVNYMYEYKVKWAAGAQTYAGLCISEVQTTSGYNNSANELAYYMTDNGSLSVTAWAANGSSDSYNITSGSAQYTATANTYYIDGFSVDSSKVRYYHNRGTPKEYNGTFSSAQYLWLGYFTGAGAGTTDIRDITVDWVLVRKFVATPPTQGVWGSEEGAYRSSSSVSAPVRFGLVGEWKFDEGSGTSAGDSSGNKNNGTITGATWVAGKHGKALSFNGTNAHVSLPTNPLSSFATSSISMWVKMNNLNIAPDGYSQTFLNLSNDSGNFVRIAHDENFPGMIMVAYKYLNTSYTKQTTAGSIFANSWCHIVFSFNGTTMTIYVNGVANTNPPTNSFSNGGQNVIGGRTSNTGLLNGLIDDVRIYNRALTEAEVKALYKSGQVSLANSQNDRLTNGLVGLWSFNGPDISGATAYDRSGSGNHGTITGANVVPGKLGQALEFNGSNDYVGVTPGTSLENQNFSVSFWVYPQSPQVQAIIAPIDYQHSDGATSKNWVIQSEDATTNKYYYFAYYNGSAFEPSGNYGAGKGMQWTDNVWQHITWVKNGTSVKGYKNGSLVADFTASNANVSYDTARNMRFGDTVTYFAPGRKLKGKMDEIRIYNRALSADEVKQLYNMGRATVRQ